MKHQSHVFISLICYILIFLTVFSSFPAFAEEYADQEQFLADLAAGISKRLAEAEKNSFESNSEEYYAFFAHLVQIELDNLDKYSDLTFADSRLDQLAHYYIEGCHMQKFAAENYRNNELYQRLWNAGSYARSGVIVTLYEEYNLGITEEECNTYRLNVKYTITVNANISTSQNDADKNNGKVHTHSWTEATCTEPKTCTICGETEGNSLGHQWTEATFKLPKTCTVCGETEGNPLPTPVPAPSTSSQANQDNSDAIILTLYAYAKVAAVAEEKLTAVYDYFTTYYDVNGVEMIMAKTGFGAVADAARANKNSVKVEWDNLKNSFLSTWQSYYDGGLLIIGDYPSIELNLEMRLVDDRDHSRDLLVIRDGKIVYDFTE
ncbi:MAG: hypothetical protein Q4F31_10325 [Eubacteriales bacterium]|nr:hypothetical protein [Eubacteriales bacterium]